MTDTTRPGEGLGNKLRENAGLGENSPSAASVTAPVWEADIATGEERRDCSCKPLSIFLGDMLPTCWTVPFYKLIHVLVEQLCFLLAKP